MAVVDLKQFLPTFFAESRSSLEAVEADLLFLEKDPTDIERMHAIFRGVHSLKGASGTFGFSEIAQLTHVMETLLDEMRHERMAPSGEIIGLLLEGIDCLRAMVQSAERDAPLSLKDYKELLGR